MMYIQKLSYLHDFEAKLTELHCSKVYCRQTAFLPEMYTTL